MSLFMYKYFFDENNEYYNKNIILDACIQGNIDIIKWILMFDYNVKFDDIEKQCLINACENNNLEIAKFIYKKNNKIYINDVFEQIIYLGIEDGNNDLVKWFYESFQRLSYLLNFYHIFALCCEYKNYVLAEWISNIGSNFKINYDNDYFFRYACDVNDVELAKMLVKIRPKAYYINILDDIIVHYEIIKTLIINEVKKKYKVNECLICWEKDSEVITKCNNEYCFDCIEKHFLVNDERCPYCRIKNEEYELSNIIKKNE